MKLKKLIKGLDVSVKGSKEVEITGVCSNSKFVAPGNLFIARKGSKHDGRNFIPDAVATGATAILTDLYDPFLGRTVQIIEKDIASLEPELASRYYYEPSLELFTVGITGTNGKTTTSYLIQHLFTKKRVKCGLVGTIEYIIGNNHLNATHTTPDACTLQKLFREMILYRSKAAVMEVTSHALDQNRADKIDFDVVLFTNLTQEHLDYHKDMKAYARAKAKLFTLLHESRKKKKIAILNADDPWTEFFKGSIKDQIWTFGIDQPADVRITDYELQPHLSKFTVTYKEEKEEFRAPLIGLFNLYNLLGAISVGLAKGWTLKSLKNVFKEFHPVPGRMQRVPSTRKNVYIDFAHTEDALKNILMTMKETKPERLITVFGCGGDRDRIKRPKMARVAEKYSDFTIVTSDNPRSEEPIDICNEIAKGFVNPSSFTIEPDRKKAIKQAIEMAKKNDIVLIAGKGHEVHQIFRESIVFLNDYEVASELLSKDS